MPEQPTAALSAAVRERRVDLGRTLAEVGADAGVSVSYLSLIERGLRRAPAAVAGRLELALEMDPGSLAALDDDGSGHAVERTYRLIRRAILDGDLRPNERILQAELAERFGVSRTPVRESLQRLEAEGLVDSSVGRGWKVHEHTAREVRDIYELRAALEGYAARLAAERATRAQCDRILELAGAREGVSYVEENEEFHAAVAHASGNQMLITAIDQNIQHHFNRRLAGLYTARDRTLARREHHAIATAIGRSHPARAEAVSRRHVARSLELVLRVQS
ncbi:FCD domain-containing protein [Pseudonocardia acaciae]|uniref:FCD domain-containing protein n=1 Tax=Pseudonocardia acaciae TaxID=551276 RepID=UPI0009FF886D|nr:FCD domain-containing protein [Pseudonocardia acaciae]